MFVQEHPQAQVDFGTIANDPLSRIRRHADGDHQGMRKQDVTILSVDIRGFTSLAERMDPEECVDLLNEYFAMAVEVVFDFGGEIDKFQGDGFMAIFSGTDESESHERRGVKCALHLRDMARSLNLPQLVGHRIPLGMGINTGIAAIGKLGSKTRSDYTVIGDVVNVAHYLQRISGPDQIIISHNTHRYMGNDLECAPLGYIRIKRRIHRVEAFLMDSMPRPGILPGQTLTNISE